MGILTVSKKDVLQNVIVEPAWYRVQIDKVEDRPSKDGKSTNTWLEGHILFNGDTGSMKFADVPTPFLWLFNSGNPVGLVDFLTALGNVAEAGARYRMEDYAGRDLDLFIENTTYEGKMGNSCKHKYRAPKADVVGIITE